MNAASAPRASVDGKLLVVDEANAGYSDARIGDLALYLNPGDLMVVNDAATLPASIAAFTREGVPFEIRLMSVIHGTRFLALLFGKGSWRTRTEERLMPPDLGDGETFSVAGSPLVGKVMSHSHESRRWVEIEFHTDVATFLREIYRVGKAIQYSHLGRDLALWDVQTVYASKPWAMEMPSAGRPLSGEILLKLLKKGIRLTSVTHAAGISSTGEPDLDRLLPLPERYEIPELAVQAIHEARKRGGKVVAVGTSVARALEGNFAKFGELRAGRFETDLFLHDRHERKIVDAILSGMHGPDETHFELLGSFVRKAALVSAFRYAEARGYLTHEFGDSCLLLPGRCL